MAKWVSDKERKLQRRLIPYNAIISLISLIAAISLFFMPILKLDVGKVMRDEGVMSFIDGKIDEIVKSEISGEAEVNYKPVVTALVKNVLGKAEGEISLTTVSSFKVLTGKGTAQDVLNEFLFGEKALASTLINSIVDGVANLFETDEGKQVLQQTVVSSMSKTIAQSMVKSVENATVSQALNEENVTALMNIITDLGDPAKVEGGKVDAVAERFVEKIDEILGESVSVSDEDKSNIIAEVQKIYDATAENLKAGESVTLEALICVTISQNVDLGSINLQEMLKGLVGEQPPQEQPSGSVTVKPVAGEADGGEPADGNSGGAQAKVIVTNYSDLLSEMGYDNQQKEQLKVSLKATLNARLNDFVAQSNVSQQLENYGIFSAVMLVFICPWLLLCLISFFRILLKNKRIKTWYVKWFCWIPPLVWLMLTLFPMFAANLFSSIWNGKEGQLVNGILNGLSSTTIISGVCYVLLWILSIVWAWPIYHGIKKQRARAERDGGKSDDKDDLDFDDEE